MLLLCRGLSVEVGCESKLEFVLKGLQPESHQNSFRSELFVLTMYCAFWNVLSVSVQGHVMVHFLWNDRTLPGVLVLSVAHPSWQFAMSEGIAGMGRDSVRVALCFLLVLSASFPSLVAVLCIVVSSILNIEY